MEGLALLQRESGLNILPRSLGGVGGGGGRSGRSGGSSSWALPFSEGMVRRLALDWSGPEVRPGGIIPGSNSVNDLCWDCTGSFLASGGDDCALHLYSESGALLRSFDPVRRREQRARRFSLRIRLPPSAAANAPK